jgi:nitroreductase
MEVRMNNNALECLKTRRSVRKYKAEQIKDEELQAVLDAAVMAPSAANGQNGKMVVIQDPAAIAEVEKLNAAHTPNPAGHTFYGAPTVIVVLADATKVPWVDDGNMLIGNLLNAAHAAGLGSAYIYRARESFDMPEGKALLKKWGIGDEYRGVGNVILGYADEAPEAKPRKKDYVVRVK